MKLSFILLMLFLISCAPAAQEVTTKPIVESKPMVQPKIEALEPQVKAPQVQITETQPPQKTTPPKSSLSLEQQCIDLCENNCAETAQNSCTQSERSTCKDYCGDNPAVDPSACTQACSYLNQPNVCKQQMEQFCSANCVSFCH